MAGSSSGVLDANTASKGLTDVFVAQLTDAGEIRHQPDAFYRGLVPHDVGNYTASVARYSAAGRGEWVRIFEGRNSSATSLAFDARGRLWAAGHTRGELPVCGMEIGSPGEQTGFVIWLRNLSQ
jgi:hypothetical protein